MKTQCLNILKKSDGAALVELAIILPVLLLLAFGVFELGRAIQAKNIITNMSREGANLAARPGIKNTNEAYVIMHSIATTADPLDMGTNGMIYITVVMGVDDGTGTNTIDPIVQEQYRYVGGGYAATSRVWGDCDSWPDGKCSTVSGDPVADLEGDGAGPPYSGMELTLKDGEIVYAVEVFFNYIPIIRYVMDNNIQIYSRNVF
jgi:hypothetical protein